MSIKSAKKLGFFASLAMLVGSIVGVGIFFKSHSILRANDWNGIGTLMAWIIGGLLSLTAALSFSEIGSMKTKVVHGLAGWSEKVGGKKYGYFVRFNYSFFYYGLLTTVLGVFASEMIFNTIATFDPNTDISDIPIYAHIILGLGLSLFFTLLNYFAVKIGGHFQIVTTVLKFIPLVVVGFAGIILATTNEVPAGGANATFPATGQNFFGHNAFDNGSTFKFTGMIAALPAVLFAFDAFVGIGSQRDKMEKPDKLPLVVIVGLVSTLVLYLLIAISAILHGSGMVSGLPFGEGASQAGYGIFDQIFDHTTAVAMGKFVMVFLLISTFGVLNGISATGVATHEQAIATRTIFGSKTLINKFGVHKTTLGYVISLLSFWTIVVGIAGIVANTDSAVDGLSNFPTLFFFGVYATTILLYTLKRDKFETKKINNILFKSVAWFAVVGIFFVVAYMLFYGFFIEGIMDPDTSTHWGLFVGDSGKNEGFARSITKLESVPFFFSMLAVLLGAPVLNWFLTKKFEKNNVFVDTDTLAIETEVKEAEVQKETKA